VTHSGILLSPTYQDNAWWVLFGLFSLLFLLIQLLAFRRKRKAGELVDARRLLAAILVALGFFAVALIQVLSHW
jgi:LPXTG-motif cell wall-anchored protein